MTAVRWGQLLCGCLLLAVAGCAAASSATAPPAAPAPAAPPPTSAQAGATTIVAVAPPAQPCCPKPTIPERLGLKGLGKGLGGIGKQILSRLTTALDLQGRFPALQPQPPLLPITHPSNSEETAPPVVKAAAEAKAEEDQAPQKVQAIRYLARLGCGGCYHNIEDALLQALDDCTEKVRYEAVSALRGKASQPCVYCKSSKCCSPKVRKKLDEIANKRDKEGCHVEPSARVRRMARMALEGCGGLVESSSSEDRPKEGPEASSANASARHDHSDLDVEPESVLHDFRWASFTKPASNRPSSDIVVARVNGAAIYDSQVSELVESKMDKLRLIGVQLDPTALQQVMHEEVERAIDVRLLMQQLRRERAGDDEPTGEEVAAWLAEKLEVDDNVSLLELSRYYESQQNRLQTQPRVRWERITANVRHFRNRDEAFKVMLYLRGRALGQSGPKIEFDRDAIESETLGWTKPDDLLSPVLSQVLFTQQLGKLSPIVEDGDYLHLVRVLERQAAGTQSFDEVSDQLKREVVANRRRDAEQRLIAELRKAARIWCVHVDGGDDVGPDAEQEPATRTAARPGRPAPTASRTDRSSARPPTNSAIRSTGAQPTGARSPGGLRTSATSPGTMTPNMTSPPPMAPGATGTHASSPSPMATGGTSFGGARQGEAFAPRTNSDVAPVAYEESIGTPTAAATPSPTPVRSQASMGSAGSMGAAGAVAAAGSVGSADAVGSAGSADSIGAVAPVGPSAGKPAPARRGPASAPGLLVPPVSPLRIPSLALPPTSTPASTSTGRGAASPISAAQPLQPARSFVQPLPPAGAE